MSEEEQTSPMMDKDKEPVPDGTGSAPSDGKKSRLDRIKRIKMGKKVKSVSVNGKCSSRVWCIVE